VPKGDDQNVYLVVDDLGRNDRVYRETDLETADLETVILDLLEGQYKNPVRVVASTPSKAGRRMSQRTLLKSCVAAATGKCETNHPTLRILFNAMTGSSTGN
jgi:hypothetical protein